MGTASRELSAGLDFSCSSEVYLITERQMRAGLNNVLDGQDVDPTVIFALILFYFVRRFGGPQECDVELERREPNEIFGMLPENELIDEDEDFRAD